jgi:hypothetical protein
MPRLTRTASVALLGAVVAFGIPTGFALAANKDAHGDTVSTVAKTRTGGTGDSHGDAVSTVAKANAGTTGHSNGEPVSTTAKDGSTGSSSQHPSNHGADVSAAARNHSLVGGPHHNHGGAVSAVAHKK